MDQVARPAAQILFVARPKRIKLIYLLNRRLNCPAGDALSQMDYQLLVLPRNDMCHV
jgi:hypothetical protein